MLNIPRPESFALGNSSEHLRFQMLGVNYLSRIEADFFYFDLLSYVVIADSSYSIKIVLITHIGSQVYSKFVYSSLQQSN